MKTINKLLLIAATGLIVSGCSGLELTSDGEKIRVLGPNEVSSCKKIGKTNTTVTDAVAGVKRPIETIERELLIIARNSAANMNGDTIVPLTVVDGGKQSFNVYKCVDPEG